MITEEQNKHLSDLRQKYQDACKLHEQEVIRFEWYKKNLKKAPFLDRYTRDCYSRCDIAVSVVLDRAEAYNTYLLSIIESVK